MELVPSYGRDYKTAKEVKTAWEEGKDFTIAATGQQINKADAANYGVPGGQVLIRYKGLTNLTAIKVKK